MNLSGRVCVLSGGSAGIGLAIAKALHDQGVKMVTSSRGPMPSDLPDGWRHIQCDVADPQSARLLIDTAVEAWGHVDIAIANAGVGYFGGIADATDEQIHEMVATNLEGTIWLVRAAVNRFRAQGGGGDLVLISSAAGYRGEGFEAVYSATKHGQVGLAGALDRELAADGIRTVLVCPSGVETEFAIGHGRTHREPRMSEFLQPEDVADCVLGLLHQSRSVRTTSVQFRSVRQEG